MNVYLGGGPIILLTPGESNADGVLLKVLSSRENLTSLQDFWLTSLI